MNRAEMENAIKQLTTKRQALMFREKQEVYAGEFQGKEDAHGNFKRLALKEGLTPLTVLDVLAGKHWDAIKHGNLTLDPDGGLAERFGDLLNYLEIRYTIMIEEQAQKRSELRQQILTRE